MESFHLNQFFETSFPQVDGQYHRLVVIINQFIMHKSFLDDVPSIYFSISPKNLDYAHFFLKFLTHWLAYHILGQDQGMSKQIRVIQSGVDPSGVYDTLELERA